MVFMQILRGPADRQAGRQAGKPDACRSTMVTWKELGADMFVCSLQDQTFRKPFPPFNFQHAKSNEGDGDEGYEEGQERRSSTSISHEGDDRSLLSIVGNQVATCRKIKFYEAPHVDVVCKNIFQHSRLNISILNCIQNQCRLS